MVHFGMMWVVFPVMYFQMVWIMYIMMAFSMHFVVMWLMFAMHFQMVWLVFCMHFHMMWFMLLCVMLRMVKVMFPCIQFIFSLGFLVVFMEELAVCLFHSMHFLFH
uniref:Uncharacterized protein n=1 Tax=Cacopsylla melanoneura TaxID=428564 RepID=A0A8D9F7P7_9HEMI